MYTFKILQAKILHRAQANFLAVCFFILCSASAAANTLTASVDRNSISLQETFTLIITADEQTKNAPDFSALKNDFDVLSTSRSQSIRIINGRTESSTDWHITLAPKHAGTLLIPSFNVDDAVSDAIEIHVSKQNQTNTQSSDEEPVKVTIETSKQSAFVQEQILVKIKLITQVNLSQAELQPLELKNAVVVNLDQQQYQTSINGKQHLIVETSYAIFPQQSGDIIIPSLSYNVAVDRMRDVWGDPFGRNRNNILRLRTDEQRIEIKPAPQNSGNDWQPANKITLNEGWSSSLNHLKVGEPVTRTVTIAADGLTGGQIAPLSPASVDGLTFYPDQAQTKDNKTSKGVQGTRTETMAIVPNHGGTFTLPEVIVNWWDVNTQTIQTATLPAKTLTVLGDINSQTPASTPLAKIPTAESDNHLPIISQGGSPSIPIWLWIITSAFILISFALAAYILKLKSKLKERENTQQHAAELISEKEKEIWDLLKHAATNKDAVALRKAILGWARFNWQDPQIHSLEEVAKLGKKEELTESLRQLDTMLYSNHPTDNWEPTRILQLLNECRKERNAKKKSTGLQPLYQS